jgi:hypothetical protein
MHLDRDPVNFLVVEILGQRSVVRLIQMGLQSSLKIVGLANIEIAGFISKDVNTRMRRNQFRFGGYLPNRIRFDFSAPIGNPRNQLRTELAGFPKLDKSKVPGALNAMREVVADHFVRS